jgi:hypothetical protein
MSESPSIQAAAIHVLRLGKLNSKAHLLSAARHNLREIQAELGADSHIDPTRTHLNQVLAGPATANGVVELAQRLIDDAGIKTLRSDCVWAVEMLITLPPATAFDWRNYFVDSVRWAEEYTGCPILSAVAHLDEDAPHLHLLILPLVGGRMNGSRLVGYKSRIAATKRAHFEHVAKRYGLIAQRSSLTKGQRLLAARRAYAAFLSKPDILTHPNVKTELIRLLSADPSALLHDLGIEVHPTKPPKKLKKMAQIFTSKGKGATRRRQGEQ